MSKIIFFVISEFHWEQRCILYFNRSIFVAVIIVSLKKQLEDIPDAFLSLQSFWDKSLKVFREKVEINPCFGPSLHLAKSLRSTKVCLSIRSLDLGHKSQAISCQCKNDYILRAIKGRCLISPRILVHNTPLFLMYI